MAIKRKFVLNHRNQTIRTLEELRKNCDIEQLLKDYRRDNTLKRWLEGLKVSKEMILAITNLSVQEDLVLAEELVKILEIESQIFEDYQEKILRSQNSRKFFESGLAYHNLKEYEKAIADYNQAIQLNPNDASTYYHRGLAYHHLKEYEKALADYNQALEIEPNYTDAYQEIQRRLEKISIEPNYTDAYQEIQRRLEKISIELNYTDAYQEIQRRLEKISIEKDQAYRPFLEKAEKLLKTTESSTLSKLVSHLKEALANKDAEKIKTLGKQLIDVLFDLETME